MSAFLFFFFFFFLSGATTVYSVCVCSDGGHTSF